MSDWLDGSRRFELRVLLLVAAMVVVAAIERVRRGREATRPREYAFVLGLAVLGAVAGVAFDACTSRIEPAYFIDWKGIAAGPGFERRVLELGAKAGFGLGIFVAVLLAFANTRRRAPPIVAWATLARRGAIVLAGTLVTAALLGALAWAVDLPSPLPVSPTRDGFPPDRSSIVWWTHLGAYLGALIGTTIEIVRLRGITHGR